MWAWSWGFCFQAEDGIRDHCVTGVQTCALPISTRLFELLGFERVPAPAPIAQFVSWIERDGTQIHLIHTPEPTTPHLGHPAVVASDFDAAISRLREAGFEVEETRELWGEPRAFALLPGGGRVE